MNWKHIDANGHRFAYLECGPGDGPLVLCLHGFPDTARTFRYMLPALAEAGYRAVAPVMRGYDPDNMPADGDYSIPTLGRDALALIDVLGPGRAAIFGHDWGCVSAYAAAGMTPERVSHLITAAVPHPARILRYPSLRQLRRSWYIGFFQLPVIAERVLSRDNFAMLNRLWRSWSPDLKFSEGDLAPLKETFRHRACLKAALAYYRSLPGTLVLPRYRQERRRLFRPVEVPALAVYGENDGCLGAEMFAGMQRCFAAPYELLGVPGAGHFMHLEQPLLLHEKMLGFLARH